MGVVGSTWQVNGYAGQGNVHDLIGTLKGRVALVVGSGDGVFEELHALSHLSTTIFAVNDIGMFLPHVDHWVSLHGANLNAWKQVRWLHPRERELTKYHSIEQYAFTDYTWANLTPCFALSGYFAMQIAYIMGADQIILCGCPGDGTRRFFDIPGGRREAGQFSYGEKGVKEQVIHEMNRLPDFAKCVRSMSGWTREFFGSL
jgi:hypothetical protein